VDKKKLREKARNLLKGLTEEEIATKSLVISKQLKELVQQLYSISHHSQGYLGAYAPIQQEVIWYSAFDKDNIQIAVPHLLDDKLMGFYATTYKDLASNSLSLKLEEHQLTQPVKPKIIVIPGLAFTIKGQRLGRGKGYYDRYLSRFDGVKIGIAFDCQIFSEIQTDKYDVEMDYLITETNLYNVKG
jgi:5-formyltetrahydrofolate cyclo-ligase